MALALLIGSAGGYCFYRLHLPLPWMLGALVFTLVAAVARVPMRGPDAIRPPVVVVIGVLLGSNFTPAMFGQAAEWALSVGALAIYLVLAALVTVPYYRRVAGFDTTTAYFSGMPGGLAEMILIGREMGGDERRIILAHGARIVVTVALIALWFRVIQGQSVGRTAGGPGLFALPLVDVAMLLAAGILGAWLGARLRLPAATLLGPMILSGALHAGGLSAAAPPGALVIAAQIVLGTVLGARFIGAGAGEVLHALWLSLGATLLTLALALGFAVVLHGMVGQTTEQVLLAFAPGGLTEMGLVALAIGGDVAFVALHHVLRIVMVIAAAPLAFRLFAPREPPRGG